MAFKGGVVLGTVSLNATGSGTTNIGGTSNSGTISIGNTSSGAVTIGCGTAGISVGTTANAHTSTFGSTNSTSATAIQSGSGALTVTSTNGSLTINSGTGTVGISTDATNNTLNIGTGAGVKTVTIGSTNSTSSLALNFGGSSGSTLSNYVAPTSFTPALAFGGGTTGITYGTQTGQYVRIGSAVFFRILITLTNKGSSTGNASITGFPLSAANENDVSIPYFSSLTLTALYTGAFLQVNGATGALFQVGSGQGVAAITDANFANGTTINLNGFYFV